MSKHKCTLKRTTSIDIDSRRQASIENWNPTNNNYFYNLKKKQRPSERAKKIGENVFDFCLFWLIFFHLFRDFIACACAMFCVYIRGKFYFLFHLYNNIFLVVVRILVWCCVYVKMCWAHCHFLASGRISHFDTDVVVVAFAWLSYCCCFSVYLFISLSFGFSVGLSIDSDVFVYLFGECKFHVII